MQLQLQQHSLLIGRRPAGFTEHYYTEWDDGLGKERISLFLVMGINSTQVPGPEIGKEAFQLLQDHFLNDLTGDAYERFENALREINVMTNEKEKELDLKFVPNMNVLCGVIQGDSLLLSQRGTAQGYLIRSRHVSSITEGLSDFKNKEDLFQNIASGQLDVDDVLVFSTQSLVQHMTPSDLSKIFSEQAIKDSCKEVKELLDPEIQDQMAILSFEVLEKVEDLVAMPVESEDSNIFDDQGDNERDDSFEDFEDEELEFDKKDKPSKSKGLAIPSSVNLKKVNEGLDTMRNWVKHEDRWSFLKKIKAIPPKKMLALIVLLAILTVGGIAISMFTGQKAKVLEGLESKLTAAEDSLSQAATRGAFDKTEAADLLNSAEEMTLEVLASGQLGGRASQLLDDIEEQRDYLDNVVKIDDELKLLVDFRGMLGSGSIQGVQPYGDEIVVFTQNEAYEVLIDQAQSPNVIDSTERVVAGTYFDDRDLIAMITAGGNLIEYDSGNTQFADTSDVEWAKGVDLDTYGSRIYILDPESNAIWKYTRGSVGYGGASSYLDEGIDVSGALSIAIDGSVWVLHDDGTLAKYLSGEEVDYDITKPSLTGLEGANSIYTELDISQVYVLDPVESRVLIYTKSSRTEDISYDSQYVFDGLIGALKDFYWDKERDVMVIVTESALYELDI